MFFRRFLFVVLFGLLFVFGLSSMRQPNGYARGFEQGYAAALQDLSAAAASEAPPVLPTSPPQSASGFFFLTGMFGFLLKCLLIFAAFAFLMKLFVGGRWGRRTHRGYRARPGGPRPGWGCGKQWRRDESSEKQETKATPDEGYEKQPEDVEPDIRHF